MNRETSSCNHLGAFYLTCFARVCEIFTAVVNDFYSRGKWSLRPCALTLEH